ncbi:MAG TPA: LLM class flavin-dependent oxidoreductase [Dehalococcoidia bacterium]
MALKNQLDFGFVLPCRSWASINMDLVRRVAVRADALGFKDLWVTENTLDDAFSFDAAVILTYAAAITRRIRLGASVVVLPLHSPVHVAHQFASLDYVSGGRAILGVGLGRAMHYHDFGIPLDRRVRRFNEGVDVIKALWTQPQAAYHGQIFDVEAGMQIKPVQKPHPPIWLGAYNVNGYRRAARIADGWMGAGGSSKAALTEAASVIHESLAKFGRDPAAFALSKRVFMSVDDNPEVARAEAQRWFTEVYHNPGMLDTHGFHGTPEQLREYLEELADAGMTHVLLNPVARQDEQIEALAEVVGLK